MTVYPPAPLKWQNKLALDNTHSQLSYVGHEGTVFHLSGPFAPVLGAQAGVVLAGGISGLMAPFMHLDNKGARQDGTTWYDTLYDESEITMMIEIGANTPAEMRKTIAAWFGAWDPKKQGKLCWYSPERGEWWAPVRLAKNVPDQIPSDWYQSKSLRLTWSARNDQAFWQSVDSVCPYANLNNTTYDIFDRVDGTGLGTGWNQTNTGSGNVATPTAGKASWVPSGTSAATAICRKVNDGRFSYGDNQFTNVTVDGPISSGSFIDLWGRLDSAEDYGIRGRFGAGTYDLSILHGGTFTSVKSGSMPILKDRDVLSLQCGVLNPLQTLLNQLFNSTNQDPRRFQLFLNGKPIILPTGIVGAIENFFGVDYGYKDNSSLSRLGPDYRGWGFGMSAGAHSPAQISPPNLYEWDAGVDTGFINLTNIGDQPLWPRYLIYGPGTFLIGDGPGSQNMVSFGPLLDGQVALLNTLPRLPGVIDLTPPTGPQADQSQGGTKFGKALANLISFATNNNTPPLLQQFESLFGIMPPQGTLYSLLNGRFTQPIPPMLEQEGPLTSQIACQIQGGSSHSKIIAAVTPYRRWPE